MKPASLWRCLVCLLVLVPSIALHAAPGISVNDDRGRTVQFDQAPQRIISLLPSLTETVCELGACERLVAVDRSSNYPLSIAHVPRAGGIEDPNIELMLALKPDVVLAPTSSRVIQKLEQLGLVVLAIEPKTQAQARSAFMQLAAMLQVPDAARRWQRVDDELSAAAQAMPQAARGWRSYVEVASGPYAAGASSFMGELLTTLGLANVVPPALGAFPKLNPEFVVRANPGLVILTATTAAEFRARSGWQAMDAVKKNRICELRGEQADAFSRPGPRLPMAARALVQCVTLALAKG